MVAHAIWDAILLVIAFFLPPLAAFLKEGCGHEFWISLLLTIIGWLPGVIYTWYIILAKHNGRYYIPPPGDGNQPAAPVQPAAPHPAPIPPSPASMEANQYRF